MPADKTSRIRLGDGSVIRSKERLEPGVEVPELGAGAVGLVDRDEDCFHSVLRNRNSCSLAEVPEEDVKELGFSDLYLLAESLRHRYPDLTWHDRVTVLRFFVYGG